MIIERGCRIQHNCNKKRRLGAPRIMTWINSDRAFRFDSGLMAQAHRFQATALGSLPLELGFQTLHLVFEAQLQLLQPHFL